MAEQATVGMKFGHLNLKAHFVTIQTNINIHHQNLTIMRNVFSILGGLAAGAVLGLLFAPQAGKETREQIKALIQEKMPDISKERLEALVDEVLKRFRTEQQAEENIG